MYFWCCNLFQPQIVPETLWRNFMLVTSYSIYVEDELSNYHVKWLWIYGHYVFRKAYDIFSNANFVNLTWFHSFVKKVPKEFLAMLENDKILKIGESDKFCKNSTHAAYICINLTYFCVFQLNFCSRTDQHFSSIWQKNNQLFMIIRFFMVSSNVSFSFISWLRRAPTHWLGLTV